MDTLDTFARPLRSLRLSVTDRCSLRCSYCMPEADYVWLPREALLSFEELARLAGVFTSLGVEHLRLTGGEPLLRHDLHVLVRQLTGLHGLRDLALTTNGLLLSEQAAELRDAGLRRVNVSLDTLDARRFRELTRRDGLERVLEGIAAARAAGLRPLKLDTVVLRGVNDGELVQLLEFARSAEAELRFIEYMDVGGATRWSRGDVVTRAQILSRLAQAYGPITPLARTGPEPAERFLLPDGLPFGIVASVTAPFCGACDRSRLTSDGHWFTCLYATRGADLRTPLRAGATDGELRAAILSGWGVRSDRGAEERLLAAERGALAGAEALRSNPHLEMHTRGG